MAIFRLGRSSDAAKTAPAPKETVIDAAIISALADFMIPLPGLVVPPCGLLLFIFNLYPPDLFFAQAINDVSRAATTFIDAKEVLCGERHDLTTSLDKAE
ncbi:MAG: hypothetical protein GXP03_04820 [Alphaproteobacteria bacterium]|nr:hypothetical protein [Alphaproteobacteria bacterium]